MVYFGCLLLAGAGLLMVLRPGFCWSLMESWKFSGGKPSAEYLDNMRIKGFMAIVVAVLLGLIMLFS